MIIWDETKDAKLRKERGISFEEVVEIIGTQKLLDTLEHRTRENQKIFVIMLNGRIHAVPFIWDKDGNIFLKTICPSRKLQKHYGQKENQSRT